ncbi:MAG: 16S rRNA processing protein RimM [Acidobacteriota bacterium]|nr:16S rRNA processing protein RimM [Acidobacteriota bacterium]
MNEVSLARIVRPWGHRGEVRAAILTDFPERLLRLRRVLLGDGRGEPCAAIIRSCRLEPSRRFAVLHFEGCDSIDDARRLVNFYVQIPLAEREPPPPGSYYVGDLMGCEVVEPGGRVIGRVRDVQATGETTAGAPLVIVDTPEGELLVPLAAEICREIDLEKRRIVVALPAGLGDLNRE